MNSLLADFFRRDLYLNMGATEEDRPQTAVVDSRGEIRYKSEDGKDIPSTHYQKRTDWGRSDPSLPPPGSKCPYCVIVGVETRGSSCIHWKDGAWRWIYGEICDKYKLSNDDLMKFISTHSGVPRIIKPETIERVMRYEKRMSEIANSSSKKQITGILGGTPEEEKKWWDDRRNGDFYT